MSIKKPILKVTRKCSYCRGIGSLYDYNAMESGYEHHSPRKICSSCNGSGRIDVKQDDPRFKKYYLKALEQRVDDLTTEYRNAKEEASKLGEELRKYCKELDKVVNK